MYLSWEYNINLHSAHCSDMTCANDVPTTGHVI